VSRLARWTEGIRGALRHRDLRLLFGGLVISASGSWAYNVALLAYVFDRTHSLGWVGAAGLGRFVPALVFSTYGGVVAERFERVRVMIGSDLLCLVFQAALCVAAALTAPAWVAILFAALTAVANVVYSPAVAAMLPELAGEDDLVAANALNGTIDNLVVIAGPAVGAVLLALGSASLTFGINAASFGVSALLVMRMKARSRPVDVTEGETAGVFKQMAVGVKAIFSSGAATTLVMFSVLVSFVYGTDTVLLVGVSDAQLGTGAEGFGYLLAGLGVGGVLMALVVDRLASSRRLALIITAGVAGYCLPTALLVAVHSPGLAFALQVIRGAGTLVVDVLAITALQRAVPEDVIARVFGVFFALILGAISLGTIITPPIVNGPGLHTALYIMGFVPFAIGLLGYPSLVRIDRASAAKLAELEPRIAFLEQLGIFASANRAVLERLAAAATVVRFQAGDAVVREGDQADALYAIVSGSVDVRSRGEGEEERHIRVMEPGQYFGEIGLLEHIPRTATVTARDELELYRIEGDAFMDALATATAGASLLSGARLRLARTHPSLQPQFEAT
jgi:CRP-like cAMP-binding protein/predicted MFS family arabinose efflux permease